VIGPWFGAAGVSVFDHWFSSYWLVLVVKAGVVLVFFLTAPLIVGYMEHKVLAHMQHRLGPMYAGRFHGWAQLVADGVKFIQKEDIIPAAADPWVYSMAPAVVLVPYIVTIVVIPFSPEIFALNLDVGIFFVLAISSVGVIGTLMAGWASANKFSLIGALRAAAQLIAYELPLVLAASSIVMQAGTLSMIGIAEAQDRYWFVLTQPVGFMIFVVAALAELSRPPFDMPVADSEIIFGALTEYTGLKFAFFLLSEYGGIVVLSAITSVLFLGGYRGFMGIPEPIWMAAKVGGLSFFVIWLRATYPRLREDQLQRFSWQLLIPLALVQIVVVGLVKVAVG
jgi:NADH-quinone oxidoreductase subunit H